jgi:uncharacterized protein (DUF302 family)
MSKEQQTSSGFGARLLWGIGGTFLGMVICGFIAITQMPKAMIVTHESRLGFDETVQAIEDSIKEHGWSSPGTMNLNKAMAKHNVELGPQVRVISLCKATYAKDVLTTDRYVSSLMPCRISVWQGDDGKVYVSKMNTGLMGKLFGGNIAKVMGEAVGKDEEAILDGIIRN